MIQTYAHQKELHEARIDIKTLERLFANVITEGTNCSPFESDIIVEKAKEVFAIGDHSESGILQPGQMIRTEGIRLKAGDIDSTSMRVHIRDAKGNKDRLVPLPEKTLQTLRSFWSVHRHPEFLFPNRKRGLKNVYLVDTPLDRVGIQTAMRAVVRQLDIKKNFMPFPSAQLSHPYAGIRGRSGRTPADSGACQHPDHRQIHPPDDRH